jgi:ribonuclease R
MDEARAIQSRGIMPKELERRLDLRDLIIFTIDAPIPRIWTTPSRWNGPPWDGKLGVHIADVSHYVREGTELDREAFRRGTSVYYADSVVPMLPEALSNDLCSLNPGTDRLAFSGFVELDAEGAMRGFSFRKTVIHSRVKGVYSEVNRILDGTADKAIRDKYRGLEEQIRLMDELAGILSRRRFGRGALDLESTESKIDVGPDGVAVGVRRGSGASASASSRSSCWRPTSCRHFRHGSGAAFCVPGPRKAFTEKLEALPRCWTRWASAAPRRSSPRGYRNAGGHPESGAGTRNQSIVNNTILRSMAKARYYEKNLGHYGLVLQNYTHFTSPIRRYPDLAIHRIMTAVLAGTGEDKLEKRFREFVSLASARSSEREQKAMNAERDCESCYKAEYMKAFVGRRFEGVISAVASHGLYVELENTVEGLVRARQPDWGRIPLRWTDAVFGSQYGPSISGGGCGFSGFAVRGCALGADRLQAGTAGSLIFDCRSIGWQNIFAPGSLKLPGAALILRSGCAYSSISWPGSTIRRLGASNCSATARSKSALGLVWMGMLTFAPIRWAHRDASFASIL